MTIHVLVVGLIAVLVLVMECLILLNFLLATHHKHYSVKWKSTHLLLASIQLLPLLRNQFRPLGHGDTCEVAAGLSIDAELQVRRDGAFHGSLVFDRVPLPRAGAFQRGLE